MGHEPVNWKTLTTIICKDCDQESYPVFAHGRAYARCQECLNKRQRELRRKRQATESLEEKEQRIAKTKEKDWKHHYGLTREKYDELFQLQGGACAICKLETELNVDHDHTTGDVRGLLCQKCNHAIGLLRESPKIILNAYDYLDKTKWNRGLELVKIGKRA